MADTFGYEPAGATHGYEPADVSHGYEPVAEAPQTNLLSSEGLASIGKNIVPSIKQGLLGLKLKRQENPEQNIMDKPLVQIPGRPMDAHIPKPEDIAQTQKELQDVQAEIRANAPQNPSYPLKIATGAVQSVVQNAPALALSILTRNPTPAVVSGAAQAQGQSYADSRTPNEFGYTKANVEDATLNANIHGAAEGGLELLPVGKLLADIGKESFAKTALKFVGREEMTEIPTTIVQNISDQALIHPEKPFNQFMADMGQNVLDTALTTPFAAGGTVALAKGVQSVANIAARKEEDKQADLATYKNEALAALQKQMEQNMAGIPPEVQMEQELNTRPGMDIPNRPLTPEEEKLAKVQAQNLSSGASNIPPNPVAELDSQDVDKLLSDPVYQTAEDHARQVEDSVQFDMDRGMSEEVARRRAMEKYPNQLPPTQRPIAWSSNPEQVGLNLKQTQIAPGGVILLGGNEEQFSPEFTKALGETITQWSQKFMPANARILVNLSGLKGEAVGGYQQSASGVHIITPRELIRSERAETKDASGKTVLGMEPGTGYNPFTQQQLFGALSHEFGHAVTMANFAARMPAEFRDVISQLDSGKQFGEHQLAVMPQEEAAVIRDFQDLKNRVLNGSMTAEELVERWLGVWKLGKDLMKAHQRTLYSHANEVLLREAKLTGNRSLSSLPLSQIPARTLIHAMGRNANVDEQQSNADAEAYYLQFNEYMAEQFSRYAHANKIDQGTLLGNYFRRALNSLRQLFKALKTHSGQTGESVIKPGESFQSWVDKMMEAKALSQALAQVEKKKPARKRKVKEKIAPTVDEQAQAIVTATRKEEEAAGEGNAPTQLEEMAEDKDQKEQLKERVRALFPDIKDNNRAEIMRMIARGQMLEAEDLISDIEADRAKVKKDVDPDLMKSLKALGEEKQASFWQKAVTFFREGSHKILQLQQLAHTSEDEGLITFTIYQNKLMAMKNMMLKEGTDVAKAWENLSRRNTDLLEKLLMDEFESGGHTTLLQQDPVTGKWTHSVGPAYIAWAKARGVDITTPDGKTIAEMVLKIKNSILNHIQTIEDTAIKIIERKFRNADLLKQKRTYEVRQLAEKWRRQPFVPQSHYGNFIVKVYDKDTVTGKRTLVWKQHYTSAAEQDAAVKKMQEFVQPENLRWGKIDEKSGPQLILPKDFLETLAETGEFTSDQLDTIAEATVPLRPEKAFSKIERDASRVGGASQDILRNYANWIEDSANFVSKLMYGQLMTRARAWTRNDMNALMRDGKIEAARQKQQLLDTMTRAQDFIMHPMDEWFKTRSVIALTYLMYAPKTALMNATGLFQTMAALTADYGELLGTKLFATSIRDLMTGKLTADEHRMKNQALEDGIIDQGFGYFMSGLANAGNLARRVRPTLAGKAARGFVDLGMWPFKAVETANRNITLLSMYRAERHRLLGLGYDLVDAQRVAYDRASSKTRLLQNDYSSGNRPELLRGKKSLFMIFLSYPQYMLWIMSGGYERGTRKESRALGETPRSKYAGTTVRMWLTFLLLAGVEGVPFGEAILELLQRMSKLFGKGDNVRLEGQRFLKDTLGVESMYWRGVVQRGFLHDILGVDLSGSYSLGKPLPGLGLINPRSDNWREFVGEAFEELAGPFGGVTKGGLGLGMAEDVDSKELGKNLPGTLGSVARAVSASQSGVKSSKGERILRDEQGNLREPTKAELLAIGAGFRLSEVARFQELEALKRDQVEYWNGRRTGLKQQYLKAYQDRDPKLMEDVDKAIAEYNMEIPNHNLRLAGKELNEYRRNDEKRIRRLEQDRYPKRVRELSRDVDRVMSEPRGNSSEPPSN